jgi:tetratricopeptide (TPR) repeat protein
MKLSFGLPQRQLLFLLVSLTLSGVSAFAQQAVVRMRTGAVQQGTVLGVTSAGVELQFGTNKVAFPLAQIAEIQMAAPPDLAAAQQAYAAKDYAKALKSLQAVTQKFKGLPTEWAQLATGMIGDVYVAQEDLPKAEAAYKEFQRLYPGAGSAQADVGMARIAVGRKDFATAKQKLEPIAAAALKEKSVPRANAFAYSQAFYVLGQVKESEGNVAGALEDYLRTITLFYHDPAAVSAAQERAEALRAAAKQKQQLLAVP